VSVGRIADAADFIRTPERAAAFFKLAVEARDLRFFLRAIEVLAKSKGMADALAWAGLPHDLPRRAAAEGPSGLQFMSELARCLGARLDVPAVDEQATS
jgi:DNA-binding phage protein